MTQGNLTVAEYYTKLKMLWDELLCLLPLPQPDHNSETTKQLEDMMFSGQLMEFLMSLHDGFDPIRN